MIIISGDQIADRYTIPVANPVDNSNYIASPALLKNRSTTSPPHQFLYFSSQFFDLLLLFFYPFQQDRDEADVVQT